MNICLFANWIEQPAIGWAKFGRKLEMWSKFWTKLVILDGQKCLVGQHISWCLQIYDVGWTAIHGDGGGVQRARGRGWSTLAPSKVRVLRLLYRHRRIRQHLAKHRHVCHSLDGHRQRDVTGFWRHLHTAAASAAAVPGRQQLYDADGLSRSA